MRRLVHMALLVLAVSMERMLKWDLVLRELKLEIEDALVLERHNFPAEALERLM